MIQSEQVSWSSLTLYIILYILYFCSNQELMAFKFCRKKVPSLSMVMEGMNGQLTVRTWQHFTFLNFITKTVLWEISQKCVTSSKSWQREGCGGGKGGPTCCKRGTLDETVNHCFVIHAPCLHQYFYPKYIPVNIMVFRYLAIM